MACMPIDKIEIRRKMVIWWFHKSFSQDRINFGGVIKTSYACTVIAVLVACRCHQSKIKITRYGRVNITEEIISVFEECVLFGNEIHKISRAIGVFQNLRVTVPEAIMSVASSFPNITEWRYALYISDISMTLHENVEIYIKEWKKTPFYKNHPPLYIVLVSDGRTILIMSKNEMVTVVDPHQHNCHGAFIAQAPEDNIKKLCKWTCDKCFDRPTCFELTAFYFSKPKLRS